MAYSYGGQIQLDQSIEFLNKTPLDIRAVVPSVADLSNMDSPYIGLLTYVQDINRVFVCKEVKKDGTSLWTKLASDSGIPLYTTDMLENLDEVPEHYIHLNSDADLAGSVTDQTYKTTINGNYADILFSALRALQTEIAKLKNSFIYGINSYTGTDTALSAMQEHYTTEMEDEPLWAIDEADLTVVYSLDMLDQINPTTGITIADGTFTLINPGTIADLDGLSTEDAKLVMYFDTDSPNIQITLTNEQLIDINAWNLPAAEKYHMMVVISRQVNEKGENYIWVSAENAKTDWKLKEGYLVLPNNEIQSSKYTYLQPLNISDVTFNPMTIYNFTVGTKYQDFTNSVQPIKPSEEDYKFKAAHITIRSVKTYEILQSIQYQIQNNELVLVEESTGNHKSGLYIKNNNRIISLSGSTSSTITPGEDTMDQSELISILKEMGIVYEENGGLELNNIKGLTFIHEETGKTFDVGINAYGELHTSEVVHNTLESRLAALEGSAPVLKENDIYKEYTRGFVGKLGLAEFTKVQSSANPGMDLRLYADRVKIGAFYAPRSTNTVFGCSHAYVELENTGSSDFNLEGCYLHYAYPVDSSYKVLHLKLKGVIPAGGTFLIRGKQYAEFTDSNTFIKVLTFDQEWYLSDKTLVDFTYVKGQGYGFCLTYGEPELAYNATCIRANDNVTDKTDTTASTVLHKAYYIDSVYFSAAITNTSGIGYWTNSANCMDLVVNKVAKDADVIFKNSFELDPAKQAFQGLHPKDSSRLRNANVADYYYIPLENEYLSFPKSSGRYSVSNFTPKASFEHKNVCTDKSKLNPYQPNMVTCSFGIDTLTTRCFNWISVGLFDEYIWVRPAGGTFTAAARFESYKTLDKGEYSPVQASADWERKVFDSTIINPIYARITSRFPADNTQFTSHKCILHVKTGADRTTKTVYEYVVGRSTKDGLPDPDYCSEVYSFSLYPKTWHPRIWHTSDQQGFHWVEYQVWAASAGHILETIETSEADHVVPVLMNTGDMTQSGARINEWLDYYEAGKELFKKYEQMNVVGNNDLCGTVPTELGTGDDSGKSNSYYFHLFYCYEVDPTNPPLINGKVVPSLYYFDFSDFRILMINSELTPTNASQWFGLTHNGKTVNPYTGWTLCNQKYENTDAFKTQNYYDGFTTVYTMIYRMMDTDKQIIPACHEMPFTVITQDNIASNTKSVSRSLSGSSLVGSHMNQLSSEDQLSQYWFSRLCEYKGVKLVLGGHKHTYAVTYPLREYYKYDNGTKDSSVHGVMAMAETLKNDDVEFTWDNTNHSKFPLMTTDKGTSTSSTIFYPYTYTSAFVKNSAVNHDKGVVYFMLQSTGFKLFSNKELPSVDQKFSQFIPKSAGATSASPDQRSPMYAIIDLASSSYTITLLKLLNIQRAPTALFTPLDHGTTDIVPQYLRAANSNESEDAHMYGVWDNTATALMTIS